MPDRRSANRSTALPTKYQRFNKAFDTIKGVSEGADENENSERNANLQLVENFVAHLSAADETKIDIAMSQRAGTISEKVDRATQRALILVLIAKTEAETPSLDHNIIMVCEAVREFGNDELKKRLAIELKNITSAQRINSVGALSPEWRVPGWEGDRRRPLLAGSAIGRRGSIGPGTLGCFVFKEDRANVFLLSNAHVLLQQGSNDNEILQPPHVCGGSFFDVIADFQDKEDGLDAALAKVRPGMVCINQTPHGREIKGHTQAVEGMRVTKYGVATRERFCEVTVVKAPDARNLSGVLIKEQMIVDVQPADLHNYALQVQGDSGCVLVDDAGNVVGLAHGQGGVRAANPKTQLQATHIGPILERFSAQILVGQVTAG